MEMAVCEDFGIDAALPAFQTTAVEFTPEHAGEFRFRCAMNMLKGLLVVENPATSSTGLAFLLAVYAGARAVVYPP